MPVTRAAEVPPGTMRCVAVDGARVLLANVGGVFHALRDACGHRQASLSRGTLDGHVVECPLHFARFDVRTGALVDGPVSADVWTHAVVVDGDTVCVSRHPIVGAAPGRDSAGEQPRTGNAPRPGTG